MRQRFIQRCQWIHFVFAIYWARGLPLRVVCAPIETLLENTNFSFVSGYKLEIASVLGLGAWAFFPSQGWDPIGPDLCGSCAYCLSLRGLTWTSVWCLEGLGFFFFFFWYLPSPLALSTSNYLGSCEHWGKNFDGAISFRAECFKVSYSLH